MSQLYDLAAARCAHFATGRVCLLLPAAAQGVPRLAPSVRKSLDHRGAANHETRFSQATPPLKKSS